MTVPGPLRYKRRTVRGRGTARPHCPASGADADPEKGFYFRSDHWNYAKRGIPIIFYFDGVHADYHKPTDTVDKIDFTKLASITRLVFETGWRIANLDHRLAHDAKPATKQ